MKHYDRTDRLIGVDPTLIAIMITAAFRYSLERRGSKWIRFTSGIRSREQQKKLVDQGKSPTMNSYHLRGKAIDVAIMEEDGSCLWDFADYLDFSRYVMDVSDELSQIITWGGDWSPHRDGPHFQIEPLAK